MARAQWSPRVWEPMTKEGHSLSFCQGTAERFPGMTLPCPASSLWGCGTVWGDTVGPPHAQRVTWSPQEGCWVLLCPCSLYRFSAISGGKLLGIRLRYTECRGKGTKQESAEVQTCPSAWVGQGLGRQLTQCSHGARFLELLIMPWLVLLILDLKDVSLCIQVNLTQKVWLSTKA